MKHLSAKHGALLAFTIIQRSPCLSLLHVSILSSVSSVWKRKEKMSKVTIEITDILQSFRVF